MWRRLLVVLSLIGLTATAPSAGAEDVAVQANAWGNFRLVKTTPATTAAPEITLPAGYTLAAGSTYQVPSRAEYYSFIQGPSSPSVRVTVRWPGVPVSTVITNKNRLAITPEGDDRFSFTVPVTAATATALQPTLQVWSYPSGSTASGVHWRMEHNDPDRVAGVWNTVRWPDAATRTFPNLLVAANAILQDSGLAAEARRRGHFFSLMGFETNNTLHSDNPPHWHLAYYPGLTYSAPRAHVPHFWMDSTGKTYYNGMDVAGEGRSRFYAGDPAPIEDVEGNLIVTLTIRADGGLDIEGPNGPKYEITSPGGQFTRKVDVYKDGRPWRWFGGSDDVKGGVLALRSGSLTAVPYKQTTIYLYDPLTGVIRTTTTTTG